MALQTLQTKTIMANGSRGHHRFTLNVIEESINVSSNKSPISYNFVLSPLQAGWDWGGWGSQISYSININDNTSSGTISDYDGSSTITLKTGNYEIEHNEDGTKSISISFTVTDSTGQSYTCGNASASDTMTLNKIPRANDISVANYDLGQNPNIVIGKKATTFTSTLSYKVGTRTGTLIEKTSANNYVWVMSSSLIEQIKKDNPKNKRVEATIYCNTYDGTTQIGSQTSATFILTIIDKPTITKVAREELNADIKKYTDKVLRHASKNRFTVTATAPVGTTIETFNIKNGTQVNSSATNVIDLNDIQTFTGSGTNLKTQFIVSCVDERGNPSDDFLVELDFIDYVSVSINKTDIKLTRTTSTTDDARVNLKGNFFNGVIGSTQNKLTIKYKYKLQNASSYSDLVTIASTYSGNTFNISDLKLDGTFDYQENYEFVFYVSDLINSNDEATYIFTSSIPVEIHHKNGAYIKEIDTDKLAIKDINILDILYPIGSPFLSIKDINPETIIGGKWEKITDAYLAIAGSEFKAGEKEGTLKVTLDSKNIPPHSHQVGIDLDVPYTSAGGSYSVHSDGISGSQTQVSTSSTGNGEPFDIKPTRYSFYCWIRTA